MNEKQLHALGQLASQASSGPWFDNGFRITDNEDTVIFEYNAVGPEAVNNASFVVAARMAIPVLIAEIDRLRNAITAHRDQRGDDRCWLDDRALYAVLDSEEQLNTMLPPREEFLGNCAQFWASRQSPDGVYQTEAERLAIAVGAERETCRTEIEHLRAQLAERI